MCKKVIITGAFLLALCFAFLGCTANKPEESLQADDTSTIDADVEEESVEYADVQSQQAAASVFTEGGGSINWDVDTADVVVPLDLAALWDESQGAYAIPGVIWGTDKAALLAYYGVDVLSEYPINNPELWFVLALDGTEYDMTPVFGFNDKTPCCNMYAKNYAYTAEELSQLSCDLQARLTELYGQPELDELDNEALQYSDDPAEVWHADFCDWRVQTPEGNTSILSLAVTTCNGAVQEIELDLFYRYAS